MVEVELIDGGTRKERPLPRDKKLKDKIINGEKTASKKMSYSTEDILRDKYDKSFKNGETKRSFSMGVEIKDGKIIYD